MEIIPTPCECCGDIVLVVPMEDTDTPTLCPKCYFDHYPYWNEDEMD